MVFRRWMRIACESLLILWPLQAAAQTAESQAASTPAAQAPTAVANPDLRRDLLARMEKDQKARQGLIEWMREQGPGKAGKAPVEDQRLVEVQKIDEENRAWLKQLIEKSGWPVASQVGQDGAHAAWLLVQHADDAPDFQKQCLELMRKTAPGEVAATDVAYLTDRVMVRESGKQLYGTQLRMNNGKWEPVPLAEPERVDALRKELGMPPLAEYLELVSKVYSGSPGGEHPAANAEKSK